MPAAGAGRAAGGADRGGAVTGGRRQWLRCALGLGAALAGGASTAAAGLRWKERALLGFGTTLWLRAAHADGGRADAALDAVVTLLRHLESQLSLFDPASALCRLNRDGVLRQPDPALVDLLQQAQAVSARSQGAFDVTVQPLWAAWQQATAAGRLPTQLHLMEELKKVSRVIQKLIPSAPHHTVLVLDGNTGQNALAQVKAFHEAITLTSLIITKMDGTAKGGVLCAIAQAFLEQSNRPFILGIGVGEGLEQIQAFQAAQFAHELLAHEV